MAANKTDIFVYAHWLGMTEAKLIGILSAHEGKGRKSFSFAYEKDWLTSNQAFLLDLDIQNYSGPQFPVSKENFGIFLDSMPDTLGRTLLKRRANSLAKKHTPLGKLLISICCLVSPEVIINFSL
jgi:serine/threonine-protein kinase HipA